MKQLVLLITMLAASTTAVFSQYEYEPSAAYPYGRPNPEAPKEIKDYQELIGSCSCTSTLRNKDGNWAAPEKMTWTWRYIMNGMAVQDMTLKEDGGHTGSIRQFIADSAKWYVHFYSNKGPTTTLPTWEGNRIDDTMVLYKDSPAPNGMEGDYRLTFSNITKSGYDWAGEWVSKDGTIVYPTWKIVCTKD